MKHIIEEEDFAMVFAKTKAKDIDDSDMRLDLYKGVAYSLIKADVQGKRYISICMKTVVDELLEIKNASRTKEKQDSIDRFINAIRIFDEGYIGKQVRCECGYDAIAVNSILNLFQSQESGVNHTIVTCPECLGPIEIEVMFTNSEITGYSSFLGDEIDQDLLDEWNK